MPTLQVDRSFREALTKRNISGLVSTRFLLSKYNISPGSGLKKLFLRLSNFQMIVLGDSVTWGQGLAHDDKSFNIVQRHIKSKGKELNIIINNYAHSGAIMGDEILRLNKQQKNGEVPSSFPTIFAQLDMAQKIPGIETELIILNGGINDVGFTAIIDPVSDVSEKKLRSGTRINCGDKMKRLLTETHEKFPAAQIMVTGYFNMISVHSSPVLYLSLLSLFGALPNLINALTIPALFAASLKRSKVFFEISQQALKKAVLEANKNIGNNAVFIKGDWKDEYAIFAKKSRLFGFDFDLLKFDPRDANPLNVVLEDDPSVAKARLSYCMSEQGDLKCPIACIGHPNIKGASSNAEMIIEKLRVL